MNVVAIVMIIAKENEAAQEIHVIQETLVIQEITTEKMTEINNAFLLV